MKITSVRGLYFSPTGGTKKICNHFVEELAKLLQVSSEMSSYTLPQEREQIAPIREGELVVWASPVYAGRVPNVTLKWLPDILHAQGNYAVVLAVFGGRSYGDTQAEMCALCEEYGLVRVANGAIKARHAFDCKLGEGHPNEEEFDLLSNFARSLSEYLLEPGSTPSNKPVEGNPHPTAYYTPLREDGTPANFLKARPVVDKTRCLSCGSCAAHCPMGSIKMEEGAPVFEGICIKCHSCVRRCPEKAISFDNPDFLSHVRYLNNIADKSR